MVVRIAQGQVAAEKSGADRSAGRAACAALAGAALLACAGCASVGSSQGLTAAESASADAPALAVGGTPAAAFDGWSSRTFPGKRPTRYRLVDADDHPTSPWVVQADAHRSASLWTRPMPPDSPPPEVLRFSWRIDRQISTASLRDRAVEDAPVRVVLAFDGPVERLPMRERLFFDLTRSITGESPPYATLMYVWDRTADVGDVIPSNSTTRIRKIVVDGRASRAGEWRFHVRRVAQDYQAAFGETPGRLLAIGVMTDSDNTGYRLRAWYGPLDLEFAPASAGAGAAPTAP
jgi:Protein of unknown function (DUF3047)